MRLPPAREMDRPFARLLGRYGLDWLSMEILGSYQNSQKSTGGSFAGILKLSCMVAGVDVATLRTVHRGKEHMGYTWHSYTGST